MNSLSSCSVPSGSPGGVEITNEGDTSITVEWSEVPCLEQNSEITHYIVEYTSDISRRVIITQTVNAPTRLATVTGLPSGTEYTVRVAARSSFGDGPFSVALIAQSKYYSIHSHNIAVRTVCIQHSLGVIYVSSS